MIHICFNLDENYVLPCKVLLRQIDGNTKEKITYHFIGIDKRDMGTKHNCQFYPSPDLSYFQEENLTDYHYFSQAAMYRLLIPFMIKADRAIYMDIDTCVFTDIKKLWDKEVDYVGAVVDPNERFRRRILKIDTKEYYNSGVILFDSKKIRKEMPDYKERILQAQKDYVLSLKDQDIFNIVFREHITSLGYEWNIDVHNLIEPDEPLTVTKAKNKALNKPCLAHCMGKEKWWNCGGLLFGDYWDSYAKELIPKRRKTCITVNNLLIIRN